MKHILHGFFFAFLCVLAGGTLTAAAMAAQDLGTEQGVGSCYEVKPICLQGHPECVCTITMQCFWACR